jgi:hypothetical protein
MLHAVLARLFGFLLDPLAAFGPMAGLTVVSAVSGLLLLAGFRATSRPRAIRAARSRVQGHLLAIRIFRDDLAVVLRSQASLLVALGGYMGQMLVPFAALLVPFALLFAHLDARYAQRALRPGERALVKAMARTVDGWALESGPGVVVETPPVRIPARGEIDWRIRGIEPGVHRIVAVGSGGRIEKEVVVSPRAIGAPPRRGSGFGALFLAPTEPPIPSAAGLDSLEIAYPPLPLSFLGWGTHWIIVFLAVSAIVAFALRKVAGVEF